MQRRFLIAIISLVLALVFIVLLSIILKGSSLGTLLLDRNSESYPLTIQNLMWIMFFFGAGELITRYISGAEQQGQMRKHFLPEDESTLLQGSDLGPINGRNLQKKITLKAKDKEGYVVGRNASLSHLVIQNISISKRHFRLSFKDANSFWLEDLNSSNGSEYGGQQLAPFDKTILKVGAGFIAGGVKFKSAQS